MKKKEIEEMQSTIKGLSTYNMKQIQQRRMNDLAIMSTLRSRYWDEIANVYGESTCDYIWNHFRGAGGFVFWNKCNIDILQKFYDEDYTRGLIVDDMGVDLQSVVLNEKFKRNDDDKKE